MPATIGRSSTGRQASDARTGPPYRTSVRFGGRRLGEAFATADVRLDVDPRDPRAGNRPHARLAGVDRLDVLRRRQIRVELDLGRHEQLFRTGVLRQGVDDPAHARAALE